MVDLFSLDGIKKPEEFDLVSVIPWSQNAMLVKHAFEFHRQEHQVMISETVSLGMEAEIKEPPKRETLLT